MRTSRLGWGMAGVGLWMAMAGCASSQPKSAPDAGKNGLAAAVLTQSQASLRASEVRDVHYHMGFTIDAERAEFDGKVEIAFQFAPQGQADLPIDLEAGTIRAVTLNGKPLAPSDFSSRFDGHRFHLRSDELANGANQVGFEYTHPYSTDGDGFYHFKDPVDGKIYLFTHFEPFFAHRLFPCFDQPDIKATYELSVQAPADWQVISNTRELSSMISGSTRMWTFPKSPVFSTYLFALHAGPYQSWSGKAKVKGLGVIPTRLFARASLAQYVDAKDWLQTTARGLDFYSRTFAYPYPFKKYDQILVPDFNAGAMENIAAVTFTERLVSRSKETWDNKRQRANTILHEMAHQWFGDLVTMTWWDGLWLNESFATFMASWSTDVATRYRPSWQSFYLSSKRSAYREDQLVTTHPIQGTVADTGQAFSSFDGITYGKGASVLRQLSFLLGEKAFTEGLRGYFRKYAYGNTSISDFIGALAAASNRNLDDWRKQWLETASLNQVQADWACDQGVISRFAIKQEGSDVNPLLREHKTEVALYYGAKNGQFHAKQVIPVSYSQAVTPVPDAVGKACPVAVFPNHDDYDYSKVVLDPVSLHTMESGLAKVDSTLARQMIWGTLAEMMTDARLAPQEFASLVFRQALTEKDSQVLSAALNGLMSSDPRQPSAIKFLADKWQSEFDRRTEVFMRQGLMAAAPGSDLQLIWFWHYLDALQPAGGGAVELMTWLRTGQGAPAGLKLDQDRRWEIIHALARTGSADATALILDEAAADPSDKGRKQAISARAALPDSAERDRWLARIYKDRPNAQSDAQRDAKAASGAASPADGIHYRLADLREAMRGIYSLGQESLIRQSADEYFTSVPRLVHASDAQDEEYISALSNLMFPPLCDSSVVQKATALLGQESTLPAPVVKNIKIRRQDADRCVHARELSASRPSG